MLKYFTFFHRMQKIFTEREEKAYPYKKKAKYALLVGICRAGMYLMS